MDFFIVLLFSHEDTYFLLRSVVLFKCFLYDIFFLCVFIFIFVFLTSVQDCNSGIQKQKHFRTDMEHNICLPVNNSDVSLGYQFCKNITFILYILHNVRYNNM